MQVLGSERSSHIAIAGAGFERFHRSGREQESIFGAATGDSKL